MFSRRTEGPREPVSSGFDGALRIGVLLFPGLADPVQEFGVVGEAFLERFAQAADFCRLRLSRMEDRFHPALHQFELLLQNLVHPRHIYLQL